MALVTGAARGQGRSHARRLAADGYDIIAVDVCATLASYPGATSEDLARSVELVVEAGGSAHRATVDVRDLEALSGAVAGGVAALGSRRVHVVVANAGIAGSAPVAEMSSDAWRDMIDIDLTGVWNTVKAALPWMTGHGPGGSIVLISSANGGLKAPPHLAHYAAAKHGVVGLMRSLANELGPSGIRVNSVHPTAVDTDMIHNEPTYRLFRPDLDEPRREDVEQLFTTFHSLPVPWIEPDDVSAAVCFLASSRARYITGVALPVDAGLSAR